MTATTGPRIAAPLAPVEQGEWLDPSVLAYLSGHRFSSVQVLIDGASCDGSLLQQCEAWRRRHPRQPLLVLTCSANPSYRAALLRAGCGDVMSAPIAVDELDARLANLDACQPRPAEQLCCRDLTLELSSRRVLRLGEPVRLTVKEFDLLHYLLRFQGEVLPRQQILHAVWGDTWVGDDNLLDVYIRYLRKKIERPDLEPLIHTIRGVGFMLK